MGRNVKVDVKGLEQFQEQFERVNQSVQQGFVEQCAKALASRMLREVIMRTPVGEYESGTVEFDTKDGKHVRFEAKANKVGGTLKRAWLCKTEEEAKKKQGAPQVPEINAFVKSLQIQHIGDKVQIIIENPMKYASYVEYGHRTRDKKRWVEGKKMMTFSKQEVERIAPALLQKRLEKKLREVFQ